NLVFPWRKLYFLILSLNLFLSRINKNIRSDNRIVRIIFGLALASIQQRIDSHNELFHKKWFGQVVIRTTIKTFDFVFQLIKSGQHQYRGLPIIFPKFLTQIVTVFLW